MSYHTDTLDDIRRVLKYITPLPLFAIFHDLFILLAGVIRYGHLPVYGVDPDPGSFDCIFIDIVGVGNFLVFMVTICSLPFVILFTLHLLINRVRFSWLEVLKLFSCVWVIAWSYIFGTCLPQSCAWVMD